MNRTHSRYPALVVAGLAVLTISALCLVGASTTRAAGKGAAWPQEFKADGSRIVFYQPQWDSLEGDTLTGRAAVAITAPGRSTPMVGAAWIEATVSIDEDAQSVRSSRVRVARLHFPDASSQEEKRLLDQVGSVVPRLDLAMGLETLTAELEATRREQQTAENLNMAPPRILFEPRPAFLVVLDGEPRPVKVEGTSLERIVNTPSFIVRDTGNGRFYLDGGSRWYAAKAVRGPWKAIDEPPAPVMQVWQKGAPKAAADTGTAPEQRPAAPAGGKGADGGAAPEVIVATEPSELIVTDGEPRFAPIAGIDLLYLSNTASDVLMDVASQQYYVLLSGRWYRGPALTGPWEHVRPDLLPDAFAKIPPGSPKADVLASVAGTPQAEEATLDAEVPQTAAVKRDEATLTVAYDGDPQFKAIPKTKVAYAVNTTTQVLRIDGKYYAVDQGVWFESDMPTGPWEVADETPPELESIPPDSPVYNTKYVYVYDATPDVVYTGYLPGYLGCYPYYGTVVWGTGWYYPGWWGTAYYPYPATWGFGAHYSSGWGWSFGFGFGFGYGYGYGYPYYGYYPYGGYYPAYAWGYPGWWGPYGYSNCHYYPGAGGAYYRAAHYPTLPATRLPRGTNTNLYRSGDNPARLSGTRDKFAGRTVPPRRGLSAGPAPSSIAAQPGSAGSTRIAGTPQRIGTPRSVGAPQRVGTPGKVGSPATVGRPGSPQRLSGARPVTPRSSTMAPTTRGNPQMGRPAPSARPSPSMRPAVPSRPAPQARSAPSRSMRPAPSTAAPRPSMPSYSRPSAPRSWGGGGGSSLGRSASPAPRGSFGGSRSVAPRGGGSAPRGGGGGPRGGGGGHRH